MACGGAQQEEGSQNVQASSYKINKYKDVLYKMINIINTVISYIWKSARVNPKCSYKKRNKCSISLLLYRYEMIDVTEPILIIILWCMQSNLYVVCVKYI